MTSHQSARINRITLLSIVLAVTVLGFSQIRAQGGTRSIELFKGAKLVF